MQVDNVFWFYVPLLSFNLIGHRLVSSSNSSILMSLGEVARWI